MGGGSLFQTFCACEIHRGQLSRLRHGIRCSHGQPVGALSTDRAWSNFCHDSDSLRKELLPAMNNFYFRTLSSRRFASISLLLCIVEIGIFACLIGLVHLRAGHYGAINAIAAYTYLFGVPLSLLCAVLGICFDSRRRTGILALGVAIACSYFCTLQMLV